MKSFDDYIDTVPIPITPEDETSIDQVPEKSSNRSFVVAMIGFMAVSGLLFGTTVANRHDQIVREVLDAERPPSTEQNIEVSQLASDILGEPVLIDCNSDKIDETHAESKDDVHTLAYVVKHSFGGIDYVPPYITMRGRLCADLLTFPRMQQPEGEEPSSTYGVRAREFAKAAAILLHEKEHIEHVFDEGEATCYAVQKLPEAIESYYRSQEDALTYIVPAVQTLSIELKAEYTSPECKPDGAFDLGLSSIYTTDAIAMIEPNQ